MKKIIKNNYKLLLAFVIGIIVASTTAYAAAILMDSEYVGYDNTKTGFQDSNGNDVEDVQTAIDELYTKATTIECKTGYIKQNETSLGYECVPPPPPKCIRATTLHTSNGVTYGRLGSGGTLVSGDAFDCDVDGTGNYTERFYYVSDLYDTSKKDFDDTIAVLIYYSNVDTDAVASTSKKVKYNADNHNYEGPGSEILDLLPTSGEGGDWSNISLTNSTRQILTETGTTSTTGGALPTAFSYAGKAARLLTAQEVLNACDGLTTTNWGGSGALDTCRYLTEGNNNWWLETPRAFAGEYVWNVYGNFRFVSNLDANFTYGVRPVIEVPKSALSL